MTIEESLIKLIQVIFYTVSPMVTLLAVSVAYLTLLKQSKPSILIHYQPNPDVPTIIDLIVENIGSGMARNVTFSQPLPARYYGIEAPHGEGEDVLGEGLPALAAGQKYVFDGGQFGGLTKRLGEKLEITVCYMYKDPLGIKHKKKDVCVLNVSHLQYITTRMTSEQAIVDALKGPNKTTLQRIEKELSNIGANIKNLTDKIEKPNEQRDT